jgi:hypothetical protein
MGIGPSFLSVNQNRQTLNTESFEEGDQSLVPNYNPVVYANKEIANALFETQVNFYII